MCGADDRELTGLGAASGEDNPARLRSDESRDLLASIFDRAARIARCSMAARGVPNHAVLPASHGLGDLIAPRRGGGVVEVVLAHATKKDLAFVNSRAP